MGLPQLTMGELERRIQERAIEIALDDRDDAKIPVPRIVALRQPGRASAVSWALADHQSAEGLEYVKVAAAELATRYDIKKAYLRD